MVMSMISSTIRLPEQSKVISVGVFSSTFKLNMQCENMEY